MKEYHKIITLFKRDPETKFKTVIDGEYATDEFLYLKDCQWVLTEKVDGTNIRIMWDGTNVSFGGKTDNAQLYAPLQNRLQELFYSGLMSVIFGQSSACLYGEGYGARIQKGGGRYNSSGVNFVMFDVWIDGLWLRRKDVEEISNKCSCEIVPIVKKGVLTEAVNLVKDGVKSKWGDFTAEGLVIRPEIEMRDRRGNRIITKLKTKDFICPPDAEKIVEEELTA